MLIIEARGERIVLMDGKYKYGEYATVAEAEKDKAALERDEKIALSITHMLEMTLEEMARVVAGLWSIPMGDARKRVKEAIL
jgi:hypothetical protein